MSHTRVCLRSQAEGRSRSCPLPPRREGRQTPLPSPSRSDRRTGHETLLAASPTPSVRVGSDRGTRRSRLKGPGGLRTPTFGPQVNGDHGSRVHLGRDTRTGDGRLDRDDWEEVPARDLVTGVNRPTKCSPSEGSGPNPPGPDPPDGLLLRDDTGNTRVHPKVRPSRSEVSQGPRDVYPEQTPSTRTFRSQVPRGPSRMRRIKRNSSECPPTTRAFWDRTEVRNYLCFRTDREHTARKGVSRESVIPLG